MPYNMDRWNPYNIKRLSEQRRQQHQDFWRDWNDPIARMPEPVQQRMRAEAARPDPAPAGPGFAGPPQFYGFDDYDALQQSLFDEQMAMVSGDFAGRGVLSSSMYGSAAVNAANQAQRTRWNMEMQDMARRTRWEQDEAIRQWREREAVANRQQNAWAIRQQIARQREADRQQFYMQTGAMDQADFWNLMEAAPGRDPSPPWGFNGLQPQL